MVILGNNLTNNVKGMIELIESRNDQILTHKQNIPGHIKVSDNGKKYIIGWILVEDTLYVGSLKHDSN